MTKTSNARPSGGPVAADVMNGAPGVVVTVGGRPIVVMGFIVAAGRILEIDAIADPARVRRVAAAILDRGG